MKKRGVFFSIDALVALIIIFLSILVIYPLIKYAPEKDFVQEDILKVLSSIKVGEINNAYIQQLIIDGNITDLNKSVLEQIGEFYVTDLQTAKNMAQSIISDINERENIGIWYGNKLLASRNITSYENSTNVKIARRVISGIKEGESVTGFSSRAYLQNNMRTKYFYFGGYVGEGNISARINYTGTLDNVKIEITANKDFDVYINDIYSGRYSNSTTDFTPVEYYLGAYESNFQSGENIIKFSANSLHIAGGYIRITYSDGDYFETNQKRYYFPGIQGLINLYDGFYIPNALNSMKIFLHMNSEYTTFLTIGNTTVYRNSTLGEQTITIDDADLSSMLNYMDLVNKTIPLRLGLENVSYIGLDIDIDSILVTDVSGSMEWCDNIGETGFDDAVWEENGELICGGRRYLKEDKDCEPIKIDSAIEAEKAFVSAILANNGPRIGVVEYSGGMTVKKVDTDLSTKLYIGPNPNCYEEDWFEVGFEDSSWEDYYPFLYPYHIDNCDYCRSYFRKTFQISNLDELKYVELNLYSDDGNVCFINGKEVGNYYRNDWRTYDIPKTILNIGENTIACSVQDRTGYFRFLPRLYTDRGDLIPEPTPASVYPNDSSMVLHMTFDDYSNPAKDYSNYGNDGNFVGSPSWVFGGSIYFPGSSNYISVPNSPSLQVTGDMTLEFWINPNGYLGYGDQYPIYKNSDREFYLRLERDANKGDLRSWQRSFNWLAFDPGTIKDYEWQHIVLIRDASTKTLKSYYNGVLNKTTTYTTNPTSSNNAVNIGYNFRGRMDEVAIYNSVLDESDILAHYSSASVSSGAWKKKMAYQCGNNYDPKYARARRNTETEFDLVATVKNSGKVTTTPFNVSFYKNSISPSNIIGSTMVNGLEAWGLETARINWTETLSSDTRIYVNVSSSDAELSKTNNQANQWIYVYDFVGNDLDVTAFTITPTVCSWQARTYTLTATVKNIGGVDITGTFNLNFYKDSVAPENQIGSSFPINGLNADQSIVKTMDWYADLTEDTNIIAYVDYENVISEGSESNNDYTRTIAKLLPDLRAHYSWISLNQPICSLGSQNAEIRVISYNYNCPAGATDVAVSLAQGDWSNFNLFTATTGYNYQYLTLPVDITNFQTPFKVYTKVDSQNSVTESDENNNEANQNLYAGPNIYFYDSSISIIPNPVQRDFETEINLSIRVRNSQCGPVSFKFGYYEDSVIPENLIYTEDVTLTGTETKTIKTNWTTTLSTDKTIYAVIDYDDEVVESDESNTKSAVITVQDIIGASFLPFTTDIKINPLLLEILGLSSSSCTGTNYDLFNPDSSIARTLALTENEAELNSFIDDTETWWGTCICCGIMKATDMLVNSTSPSKFMVVMSDGAANIKCTGIGPDPEHGTGSASQDAIQAACDAFNNYNIKVYSVCFGGDCDTSTLQSIANCGNGSYYYGDVNDLISIYEDIAQDIINVSYTEQTAVGSAGILTTLYPDSYIEFDFTESPIPYGLVLNPEKQFTDSSTGIFDLPPKSTIIDAKVISYSGPRWTDKILVNNITAYNLSLYGSRYTELGDPYHINLPLDLINNSNIIKLTTGLSSDNSSEGSIFNKIVYQIVKNATSYSTISASAEGCIWTIDFEDYTNITVNIPYNYTGDDVCFYQDNREEYDGNDALEKAAFYLLQQLDFDLNGKVDVKFSEQDLVIISSEIVGIPFGWSTEVQVRKWH